MHLDAVETGIDRVLGRDDDGRALPLSSADVGVVVDMAYKPAETPLLRLAKTVAAGKWHSAMGIELLLEQGYRQFELWTGRRCPRCVVSKTVLMAYHVSAEAISFRAEFSWMRPHHAKKRRNGE
jgi:pentafunctional AROM polypeptide